MDYFEFTIDLEYWPVIHTRIINIFSTTEFIIALASIFSLFLGTSAITWIEAFYCLFIRYPAYYLVNQDYIKRKIEKQEEIELKKPVPCINMSLKPIFNK